MNSKPIHPRTDQASRAATASPFLEPHTRAARTTAADHRPAWSTPSTARCNPLCRMARWPSRPGPWGPSRPPSGNWRWPPFGSIGGKEVPPASRRRTSSAATAQGGEERQAPRQSPWGDGHVSVAEWLAAQRHGQSSQESDERFIPIVCIVGESKSRQISFTKIDIIRFFWLK